MSISSNFSSAAQENLRRRRPVRIVPQHIVTLNRSDATKTVSGAAAAIGLSPEMAHFFQFDPTLTVTETTPAHPVMPKPVLNARGRRILLLKPIRRLMPPQTRISFSNPQVQAAWDNLTKQWVASQKGGFTLADFINLANPVLTFATAGLVDILLPVSSSEFAAPAADTLAPTLSRVAAGETTQLLPAASPLSSSFARAAAEGAPELATVPESSLQAARLGITSALKEAAPLATSGLEASAPLSTAAPAGLFDTIKGYASYWDEVLTGGALSRALTEGGGITDIAGSNSPVSNILTSVTGSPGAPSPSSAPFSFAGASSGGSGPAVSTVYQQRAPASSPLLTWLLWGGVGIVLILLYRLWR